jgi:hypothetical protein
MTHEAPLACTLSAEERPKRAAAIRALARDALLGTSDDGALRFHNDETTRARLEAIVAAESECCAFLDFDLRESGGELRLLITAPEGAEPVARDLAEAFAAG